jgi:RNA polymerase sigma factor (sigma-70 family)
MNHTAATPTGQQVTLLIRVIQDVARGRRLSREDFEDFAQSVHLRLLERHFDVFDRFKGRSSLKTYLRVVVKRLLLDWQNKAYGKWRPTVATKRFGEHAVALERLINRDQYSAEEAIAIVGLRPSAPSTRVLRRIADQVPRRQRVYNVPIDVAASAFVDFRDPVVAAERDLADAWISNRLKAAIRCLSDEDQRLVAMRYREGQTVQELARRLQEDAPALYRRFAKVLRSLRSTLASEGICHSRAELPEMHG